MCYNWTHSGRFLTMIILVILLAVGASGCPTPPPPTPPDPSGPKESLAPEKPSLRPDNLEVTVKAGANQVFSAASERSVKYEWALQGEGEISTSETSSVIFSAPRKGGGMSVLTVVAHNEHGPSPYTSVTIKISPASISLSTHASPIGWMSGGDGVNEPDKYIKMKTSRAACKSPPNCRKFTYSPGGGWAGVYWLSKVCKDGSEATIGRAKAGECSIDLLRIGGLTSIEKITFWARGERGNEVVEFKVGGRNLERTKEISSGNIVLTDKWKPYEIPLKGADMTDVAGLFLWVASEDENPAGATFYIDDAQFEGTK